MLIYEVAHYNEATDFRASLGLFSTREKAEAFIQRAKDNYDFFAKEYEVVERKVDEHDAKTAG